MRIIGGRWRSRRIEAPPARTTRPMPDRVREAVFDVLGSRLGTPGALPPIEVLDLFAGSGSMGLEAVSRGAGRCVFVERGRAALHVLRRNLASLDAGPTLSIAAVDGWAAGRSPQVRARGCWGLISVDPPYAESREVGPGSKLARLFCELTAGRTVNPETLAIVHHERRVNLDAAALAGWGLIDRREYGTTAITFVQADAPTATLDDATASSGEVH